MLGGLGGSIDISALIIATFGALFSIASALYLTSRKITAELRYRRIGLTNIYSENILKQRLETYPELWFFLSAYAKKIKKSPLAMGSALQDTWENLIEFSQAINEWDSRNGLLLSAKSSVCCSSIRGALRQLLERGLQDTTEEIPPEADSILLKHIIQLELALRTDLGIYEVDKLEGREMFKSYRDANATTVGRFLASG